MTFQGLERFVTAQQGVYEQALAEIRAGRKRSHWMWFIFPQIAGLGHSPTSQLYAIRDRAEALAYAKHPLLGPRLAECGRALLALRTSSATAVFGHPDNLKLHSSVTLFAQVSEPGSLFHQVIEKYFDGENDVATLRRLENLDP